MRILPISQNLTFHTAHAPSRPAIRDGDAGGLRTETNPAEKASSLDATDEAANEATRSQPADTGERSETPGNDESSTAFTQLSPEEQEVVDELQQRDTEVRRHEQAHLATAGPYAAGGPTFTYQKGPDGRTYATGGEVPIDTSPVANDPEATIIKAQTIRRAALSPAEPSAQDRSVASSAGKLEAEARKELREQQEQKSAPEDESLAAFLEINRLGAIVDEYA